MIRIFFDKKNKPKFFRVKISSPDGRFRQGDLVGGINEKAALIKAKELNKQGMIVDIFKSNY